MEATETSEGDAVHRDVDTDIGGAIEAEAAGRVVPAFERAKTEQWQLAMVHAPATYPATIADLSAAAEAAGYWLVSTASDDDFESMAAAARGAQRQTDEAEAERDAATADLAAAKERHNRILCQVSEVRAELAAATERADAAERGLSQARARLAAWEPIVGAAVAYQRDGCGRCNLMDAIDACPLSHLPGAAGENTAEPVCGSENMPKRDGAAEGMFPAGIAVLAALEELARATEKFGAFHSAHEGFAVIREEVDELWAEVKANNREGQELEAVQVAAMALRFLHDCCGLPVGTAVGCGVQGAAESSPTKALCRDCRHWAVCAAWRLGRFGDCDRLRGTDMEARRG